MKPRFRAEWVVDCGGERGVVDFSKLFTETNEQKFSLGGEFRVRRFVVIQEEIRSRAS